MQEPSAFDLFTEVYDLSIDWNSRLEREMPFIVESLKRDASSRVLDLACGTGRHSIALAKEGMIVTGIDYSQRMIEQARRYAKSYGTPVEFIKEDMKNVRTIVDGNFDLVICLGNSLALLDDLDSVEKVLVDIANLLSEDGSLVFQVLNFEAIRNADDRLFPLKSGTLKNGKDVIFARFFEHLRNQSTTKLILNALIKGDASWNSIISERNVIQMDMKIVMDLLENAGLGMVELYSDYNKNDFDPVTDRSLLVRAKPTPV